MMKSLADQGMLDAALRDAYQATVYDSVHDPRRMAAAKHWGAMFLALSQREKFASIVQTAMDLLSCEHGAITLVGEEVVVLTGLNTPPENTYPIDTSFCQYVVDGRPFEVTEAKLNNLVCDTPGVTDLGIASYLGVPIIFQNWVVGSLCVYDLTVRRWTPADVRILASLAMTVQQVVA